MNNLNFVYPEIFISISIMFLLILGVFKKNSSNLIYNLSIITLIGTLVLTFNYPINTDNILFNESYKIDYLSTFMKILVFIGGIFTLIVSFKYLKIFKILHIDY